ncbi:MAG: mechanosensitive ion channel family protein [Desulfurococcales archaeon]|nr:mechanosensitive ion channel family protein [Desulfurococcales archaeon]
MAWETLVDYLKMFISNEYIVKAIVSLIIVIVGMVILAMIKGVFKKFESSRISERNTLENMYKIISMSVYILLVFIVIYVMTQQQIIVLFLLGVVLILLAASWEVIANIAAYYALLASRALSRGDYIILEGKIEGKIKEITPLFTVIEGDTRVYTIPNLYLLKRGKTAVKEPIKVWIIIRVWGFEEPDALTGIKQLIEEKIARLGRDLMAIPETPRTVIDEVSIDGATLRIEIAVPGTKPNKVKISRLLEELAVSLKETGYSYSLTAEYNSGR